MGGQENSLSWQVQAMNNDTDQKRCEMLSAWMDGELDGAGADEACVFATGHAEGRAQWELYHLIGDVMRSPELARHANSPVLQRLQQPLAQAAGRPQLAAAIPAEGMAVMTPQDRDEAANASVFRWKMVAGVASLAAVAAIGWNTWGALQAPAANGAQLAVVAPPLTLAAGAGNAAMPQPVAPVLVGSATNAGGAVMIRDPRLDELLVAHRQFGSPSTLQMPAGFLRNAAFDTPSR